MSLLKKSPRTLRFLWAQKNRALFGEIMVVYSVPVISSTGIYVFFEKQSCKGRVLSGKVVRVHSSPVVSSVDIYVSFEKEPCKSRVLLGRILSGT